MKIYDLTVHQGYKRSCSEGLGVSLSYLIEPSEFVQTAQAAAGEENLNIYLYT